MSEIMTKLRIKPGYKQTPVGIIPEDWEVKKISELGKVVTGSTPKTSVKEYYDGNELFVSPVDIQGNSYVNQTEKTLTALGLEQGRQVPKNSVLFVSIGSTIGKVSISGRKLITNQQINSIIPDKQTHFYYLFNILKQRAGRIKLLAANQAVPILNKSEFSKIKLPIPPLPEQKSIANCLSTWDAGIEKLTQLIQTKKQQKKGLMQQLLTGSLRLRSASGEKFDGEWKEVRLGEIGETFNGLTGKTKDDFGEGSPYVSYLNVFNNNSITKETNFDFVKIKQGENQTQLKYGDLIFTTSSETPNEVGMSGVILFHPKENLFLNSFCFGLRLKDFEELEPKFAVYLLRGKQFRRKMYKLAQGSTRFNLSKAGFRKITLIAPPVEEQAAIAEVLKTADKEIELLEQKLSSFQQQKKGLMQVLLTGEKRLIENE